MDLYLTQGLNPLFLLASPYCLIYELGDTCIIEKHTVYESFDVTDVHSSLNQYCVWISSCGRLNTAIRFWTFLPSRGGHVLTLNLVSSVNALANKLWHSWSCLSFQSQSLRDWPLLFLPLRILTEIPFLKTHYLEITVLDKPHAGTPVDTPSRDQSYRHLYQVPDIRHTNNLGC